MHSLIALTWRCVSARVRREARNSSCSSPSVRISTAIPASSIIEKQRCIQHERAPGTPIRRTGRRRKMQHHNSCRQHVQDDLVLFHGREPNAMWVLSQTRQTRSVIRAQTHGCHLRRGALRWRVIAEVSLRQRGRVCARITSWVLPGEAGSDTPVSRTSALPHSGHTVRKRSIRAPATRNCSCIACSESRISGMHPPVAFATNGLYKQVYARTRPDSLRRDQNHHREEHVSELMQSSSRPWSGSKAGSDHADRLKFRNPVN